MTDTGCCGGCIRIVLSIINIIFFLIGLGLFAIGSILKWSPSTILDTLVSENVLAPNIVDSISSGVNFVAIGLLGLASFIILLSLFGLIGACCANRLFLIIYEIILGFLFLVEIAVLVFAIIKAPTIEKEYTSVLNSTIDRINDPSESQAFKEQYCSMFRALSELFDCCGSNSYTDFKNASLTTICCTKAYADGCSAKSISWINNGYIYVLIVPFSVILGFEFILLIMIPFLIGRIGRNQKRRKEANANPKANQYQIPMYPGTNVYVQRV